MKPSTLRKTKLSGRAIAFAFAVLAATAVNATDCYWRGAEDGDPLEPDNYSSDVNGKNRLTVLPAAGSVVQISSAAPLLRVDDDSVAFLSSLDNVEIREGSTLVIDISTNATVAARFYWSSGPGTVIKRGAGTLFLAAPNVGTSDYFTSFVIEEGDLVFPQSGQTLNAEYKHTALVVSNGCKVVLDGGQSASAFKLRITGRSITVDNPIGGFSGGGDIAYTNASAVCTLIAGGTTELFTGTLSGDNLALQVAGDLMLANGDNTFAYGGSNNSLYFNASGTLGFRRFGSTSATAASSFGKLNKSIQITAGDATFLCLATQADGEQTVTRTIQDYGTETVAFDGGAYGNFTFSGNLYSLIDVKRIKEVVLTGSNTEACVWSGAISGYGSSSNYGSYYLTKRGSGTWRMAALTTTATKLAKLAGIGVEDGTLAFYSLAEQGTMCSLGTAPAALLYGYPYKGLTNDVPTVGYAIRLGTATDLTCEGCLEKRHTSESAVTSCSTRPIAVTGRGRLRNGADTAAFSWSGVKSVVPPEDETAVPSLSTFTLDGSGTGANTLSDITEDVGAAPLRIAKEGTATWTLGGTLGFTGGIDVRVGTLNVGAAVSANQPYLRVDGGATLNVTQGTVAATGFAVDAAKGVGTISGVAFAAAGTICFTNMTGSAVMCDSLNGCTGLKNIEKWDVVVNGTIAPRIFVKATATGLRIAKKGFIISFR